MINLIEHIEYLVKEHDCVIVPGLGAFLADYIPARLSADATHFMPPQRTVIFNPQVNHNDGLLAGSLMRRHRLSYQTAIDAIEHAVEGFKARISSTGSQSFGRIGRLLRQEGGYPLFEPAGIGSCANMFRVLPILDVVPLGVKREHSSGTDRYHEGSEVRNTLIHSIRSSWSRVAASVAVIVVCLSAWLLQPGADSRQPELASVGAAVSPATFNNMRSTDGVLSIAVPERTEATGIYHKPEGAKPAAAPAANTTAAPVASTTPGSSYYLIVASLPNEESARQFISQNGNPDLRVVNMEGRSRVYIASSNSKDQLIAMQPAVARQYQGAWVCTAK